MIMVIFFMSCEVQHLSTHTYLLIHVKGASIVCRYNFGILLKHKIKENINIQANLFYRKYELQFMRREFILIDQNCVKDHDL